MKKTRIYILAFCLSLLILIIGSLVIILKSRQPEPTYTIPRHIEYSFTIQNKTNRLVKQAEFWAYGPVKQTATQLCTNLESSHPYKLTTDELGNQILHFTIPELPPYGSKIITIKADLLLSDTPNRLPSKSLKGFLRAEKYMESNDQEIAQLAKKLDAKGPLETTEKIFGWVSSNIQYAGYLGNERGALYALNSKKGDCTEYMYLFAALCRANNIPARGIGGYVTSENAVLKPNGYHNWVEFYDGKVWRLADPQKKLFMQDQSHYIAMRVISESSDQAMGSYERFRVAGDGLKVKMNK